MKQATLLCVCVTVLCAVCVRCQFPAYRNVGAASGLRVGLFASGLGQVRSLQRVDNRRDFLALVKNPSQIVLLRWTTGATVQRFVLVSNPGVSFTHGLYYRNGWLYASSPEKVLRWRYTPGSTARLTAPGQAVVTKLDYYVEGGQGKPAWGHNTRTLLVDTKNNLYVSTGSVNNVDDTSARSRLKRFGLSLPGKPIPAGGFDYTKRGVLVADGLRNTVGMTFDAKGRIWGVDNGADYLSRSDLGVDHQNNPAEELNMLTGYGVGARFFGYPSCFTAWDLRNRTNSATRRGSQWRWPWGGAARTTDAWCANPANNQRPALSLPAHTAPLGVTFYDGRGCNGTTALPCSWKGHAFVALHGSWNRQVPDGFKVVRLPYVRGKFTGDIIPVMWTSNYRSRCFNCRDRCSADCFRPVDVAFTPGGHLLVSSDQTSDVAIVIRSRTGRTG